MGHVLQLNNPTNTKHPPLHPAQILELKPIADDNSSTSQEILFQTKKHHRCTFPECGKIFRYKSELSRHNITHMTQRPLECPFVGCTKTFKRKDVLDNHLRLHTGETPYKCPEPGCEQSFASRATLKYHSLRHIERKYSICSLPGCRKKFLDSSQLKQHINCHQMISCQTQVLDKIEKSEGSIVKIKKCEKASDDESPTQGSICVKWEAKNEDGTIQKGEKAHKDLEEILKAVENENNAMKLKLNLFSVLSRLMPINVKRENKGNTDSDLNESKSLSVKSETQ